MLTLLAQVAAALVIGHPASVQCAPIPGHDGWWNAQAQTIVLSPRVCSLVEQPPRSYGFPYGVFVLLHEAEHAAGVENENQASCRAAQAAGRVLTLVGVGRGTVRFDVAAIRAVVRWQQGVVC